MTEVEKEEIPYGYFKCSCDLNRVSKKIRTKENHKFTSSENFQIV